MERRIADRAGLRRLHATVGAGMPHLIEDFREGSLRSIAAIEVAARARNAAAMIIPAHTLKGDALQFCAGPLADHAAMIEEAARRCVETHARPEAIISEIIGLRPLLDRTMVALMHEAGMKAPAPAPVVARPAVAGRPVFGRKAAS